MVSLFNIVTTIKKTTELTFTLHLEKLWKLVGPRLRNKANIWDTTDDNWMFIPKGPMIYIENTSQHKKVLGVNGDQVILEVRDGSNDGQLWIKGEEYNEDYFTLKNNKTSKFLTAANKTSLKIKGKNKLMSNLFAPSLKFIFSSTDLDNKHFKCKDGKCVNSNLICDGMPPQCEDKSDLDYCKNTTSLPCVGPKYEECPMDSINECFIPDLQKGKMYLFHC